MRYPGDIADDPNTDRSSGAWWSEDSFLGLNVSDDSRAALQKSVQRKLYRPGEVLHWEGDRAQSALWICSGAVKCYKLLPNGRSQITRFAAGGDFLGISSFETHDCTAEALTACQAAQIPRKVLETLADADPLLHRQIMQILSSELQSSRRQVLLLGRMHAVERLSTFLIDFAERTGSRDAGDGVVVELPMTRSDIADFLGLTIETVSRVLTKLKRDGLIAMERPTTIRLLDRDRLAGREKHLAA